VIEKQAGVMAYPPESMSLVEWLQDFRDICSGTLLDTDLYKLVKAISESEIGSARPPC